MRVRLFFALVSALFLCSCATVRDSPKYQLGDEVYEYKQRGESYQKALVYVQEDSITVISSTGAANVLNIGSTKDQFFLQKSFDVDVMTVAFKFRPSTNNLPRQLNTDFNGNVYLGYRVDRFKVKHKQTPFGPKLRHTHRGITGGIFAGIGSTAVTPWTTNNLTTDEYSGFVFTRGVSIMIGVNAYTVGLGVGWDFLTDRDSDAWIYQNKPWFGLAVGLNLN